MTPEYQFYHGAFLHEVIVAAGCEVRITLRDFHGRPDAFLLNGDVGVLIKHSSARITPWSFTFTKEHVSELCALRQEARVCFVALVCDEDGFVCIRDAELMEIFTPTSADVASLRVDRRPRKMYKVSSSGNSLDRKIAKGVQEILSELMSARSNENVSRSHCAGNC